MCGIAGIMYKGERDGLHAAKALIEMLDGCQHRGPDSTGFALYGQAAKGELKLRFFVGQGDEAVAAVARIQNTLAEHHATIIEDEHIGDNYRVVVEFSGDVQKFAGKTNLQNLEPEDLRSITLATAQATGIPLVGLH